MAKQPSNKRKTQNAAKVRKKYSEKGRPSLFTQELGDKLCQLIATSPYSLVKILTNDKTLPAYATIMEWMRSKNEKFAEFQVNYTRARNDKADFMFETMVDDTIEAKEDIITRKVTNGKASAYMAACRLEADAKKFYISKVLPKKYSEKIDITTNGESINIPVEWKPAFSPKKNDE